MVVERIKHIYMPTRYEMIRLCLDFLIVSKFKSWLALNIVQHHIDLGAVYFIIVIFVFPVSSPTVHVIER